MTRAILLTFVTVVSLLAAPAEAQMPMAVEVAAVRVASLESTRPLVATVQPVTSVTVPAELDGRISRRSFEDGERVEMGQVLAQIDTELLEVELLGAQAAFAVGEAEVDRLKVAVDNARREYSRQKKLFDEGAAPEKELLDATSARDLAVAAVKVQEAELVRRQVEVARLQTLLGKSTVSAPFAGVIARRAVELGQWVRQGDAIADIVQLDRLYVVVNVPESVVGTLKSDVVATVSFDAFPGQTFDAPLAQVMPRADEASRTVTARFNLENSHDRFRPGFFARVTLRDAEPPAMLIPRDALVSGPRGEIAYVVRDGMAKLLPLQVLGLSGPDAAVVPFGPLAEGELVVVRGNENLFPDAAVMVLNPPPSTQPTTHEPAR